jgi:soluble lytic murein transglycosylase-like protein
MCALIAQTQPPQHWQTWRKGKLIVSRLYSVSVFLSLVLGVAMGASAPAFAQALSAAAKQGQSQAQGQAQGQGQHLYLDRARAQGCISNAASYHGVDVRLLRAVFTVESSLNPFAVSKNTNGSVDLGIAQINSQHWPKLAAIGIKPEQLYDPCVASYVGAWMLKKNIDTHGLTWQSVARYHSSTPHLNQRYQARLYAALQRELAKEEQLQTTQSTK